MQDMSTTPVISLSQARDRHTRVARAIDARRSLADERRARTRVEGRVWVNGSELGGARAAFAHLCESYD